jgi:putative ubiquitin-RnfH superfamily antitoxin RatB of RatAB toxin-antitoxin module
MQCRRSADPSDPRVSAESVEIAVEVAYALPHRAVVKTFRLSAPATIADALASARSDPEYCGVDWDGATVGIFGVPAARQRELRDGDRIEIYRALAVDPKAARRARAKQKGTGSLRTR